MCCHGCQAVSNAIVAAGQERYYQVRTENALQAGSPIPDFLETSKVYDKPEIQKDFVTTFDEHTREASLILEGITCAACIWLNEQHIASQPGILDVQINYASHRASVKWNSEIIQLSDILNAIYEIGYQAHPYDPHKVQEIIERENRQWLRRLGVAGLLGMQVMMITVALYAGDFSGMSYNYQSLFQWLSLFLTLPVLLYSGRPFFSAAWKDLKRRVLGMDVPVSLGILIAFSASAMATVRGQGDVYFDSVVMFVFFLSGSKYLEFLSRKKNLQTAEVIARSVPSVATRITGEGDSERHETVPATVLETGDVLLIKPGEIVPADGLLHSASASIDESLITGESKPINRQQGEHVVAGSVNLRDPIQISLTAVGQQTVLSGIFRLVERAVAEKPELAMLADRIAAKFVLVIITIASICAFYWWQSGSDRWLEITLTVLIASCPCALSLATPSAMSKATSVLLENGILAGRTIALESLNRADIVAFDKTGTLTAGQPRIVSVKVSGSKSKEQCLAIAAALERHSEHPLAKAIVAAAPESPFFLATGLASVAGKGISGIVKNKRYFLGNAEYALKGTNANGSAISEQQMLFSQVFLANDTDTLCVFDFDDQIRVDAKSTVDWLSTHGQRCLILSGDQPGPVETVAKATGISEFHPAQLPDSKLKYVKNLQQQGKQVVMVGDGINDAPVLAAADVSFALGKSAQLSQIKADFILLGDRLNAIKHTFLVASSTQSIIRQNLAWAFSYNMAIIPAAAMGLLAPWMAAIGMSLSSLFVVANTIRIRGPKNEQE